MITNSLKVLLWDKEIGRLSWDVRRGVGYFEYSHEFLEQTLDVFPLLASIKNPASRRPVFGDRNAKLYRRLPPFLADSLPDAWGNQVFECWRIENGIRNQEITPLDVLSFIGKRGMGALEFLPESSCMKKAEKLNLDSLTVLAQRIFSQRETAKILPDESFTLQSLIAVGTSAGGRQPKAIIAINPETGEIRSGQIGGQKGFDYCILKFGDSARSSAELEMAYYEMATAAGIHMMPCWMIDVEGNRHFVTKRFDRDKDRKIHMQTLAAIDPEADSYEKLLSVCRKLRLPESTQQEIFRRMVFNILANNTDDHNKNFSFLMDESGHWRLSPAYDMTYIFNKGGFLPETMHCLMMRGKLADQSKDDALALAKENGIRGAEKIISEVASAVSQFRQFATKNHAHEKWIGAIETTLNDHLSLWGLNTKPMFSFSIDGHECADVRIEQAFKGNFHLMAKLDGKDRKFVISARKDDYLAIQQIGLSNLTEDLLIDLIRKYLLRNDE